MLITNKFVKLNFPKTGSTFARNAIKQVHQAKGIRKHLERAELIRPKLQELLMLPYFFTDVHSKAIGISNSQHGVFVQIPLQHKHKPLLTVVRDPLLRLVSLYEFRSWARHPIPSLAQARKWFPNFPDITFEEFFIYNQTHITPYTQPAGVQVDIGPFTTQFIRFYAVDPVRTIQALRENTNLADEYDHHFPKIRFIHTENLNAELFEFLLELGYPADDIAFIKDKEKMNTTQRSRGNYLTSDMVTAFQQSERFFYQLFPEYLRA